MELRDYFDDDYILLEKSVIGGIAAFLDSDDKELKYYEPLKDVYVHKTRREMFLILDCLKSLTTEIERVCNYWESKVLAFIQFGNEFRDEIEFLKYNIFLLILCQDEDGDKDDDFRYQTEKSLNICRKVFLICDAEGNLSDSETIIPFYFAPMESMGSTETKKLEEDLRNLLPAKDEILKICNKAEKLNQEEIEIMCRWLSDDNN